MPGGAPLRVVDLIRIKEADVEKLFEPRIFERGKQYYEQGRVERPVVYKKSIMAECRGTQPENYGIHIDVDGDHIVATCTCPYTSGNCKHVAAVMFAWLKNPSMFTDLGQAEELLKRQEKGALVEMVIDMVRYDPSVLYVINLRLLPPEDVPAFVRRETGVIFSGETADYLNVREIVRKLDIFREYAADLQERKGGDMAMQIIIPIIEAIINHYTAMDDSNSIMHNFFIELLDLYGDIIPSYRMVG
ncbi:MAG TPA: SWIM zinc finger family protein, partial [Methanocellaceae archaeon]